jgi:hypothetical protein
MASQCAPSPEDIERGVQYSFQLGDALDCPCAILAEPGMATAGWHCGTEPRRSPFSPLNLLRKPDFVLMDHEERVVLRIRRKSRVPPRFDMIQNGQVVGTIGLRSILRNKYAIALNAGPTWTFRMPLFTICFHGESTAESRVWVAVGPSKRQWNLLAQPGTDDVRLLAGLAFIHREWWCYS